MPVYLALALMTGALWLYALQQLWSRPKPGAASLALLANISTALSGMAGVLAERWLFFAEARRTVTLYYSASVA